jgi:magnesium chelatase subunit D
MNIAALHTPRLYSGYAFSALVGQPEMKLALILLAVDLCIGGVLLRGEKGTAKSTAARALAEILPPVQAVKGCPAGCAPNGPLCPGCAGISGELISETKPTPFVDLPLGATEDRVAGSLDIQAAIQRGRLRLMPGLLSKAHQGLLYVDEVNLLPPHIAYLVLDAAASGWNQVEREGVSYRHPSQFALVASMNPEEGPLGPQLLDRFGLCVDVRGEGDPALRRLVITRRLEYEADPVGFNIAWSAAEDGLREKLINARARLAEVKVAIQARALAAWLAGQAGAQGSRGEIACVRAARALAAWRGLAKAGPDLVEEIAPMAFRHRAMEKSQAPDAPGIRLKTGAPPQAGEEKPAQVLRIMDAPEQEGQGAGESGERTLYILPPEAVKPIATRLPAREGTSLKQAGRRAARQVNGNRGRYLRASAQRLGRSLAFDATLRAAAPHQIQRRALNQDGPLLQVRQPDIREKVRAAKRGRLIIFCVDASGSMNAAARMRETKSAVLGLLTEAYQKRDRVGLVAFGGLSARELLPPTSSMEVARRMLADLPTGGKTPLASGLVTLSGILERELAQDPKLNPLAVILTDGRPNVPLAASSAEFLNQPAGHKGGGWGDGWGDGGYADREVLNLAQRMGLDRRPRYVVVDTDVGHHHEINLCRAMADYMGAHCVSLRNISAGQVLDLVRQHWH